MSQSNKAAIELPEDIEIVGPGQMLAEARKKMGLSVQDVAEKLNFRLALVNNIEKDVFDKTLPATFNRGYLKNYAKLVAVAEEDILASYEMISVAEQQGAEMQSFSKQTEKQAENNRLMWISYLILAVLIGSTLMWWLQESTSTPIGAVEQNINNNTAPVIESTDATPQENIDTTNLAANAELDVVDVADTPIETTEKPAETLITFADTLVQTPSTDNNTALTAEIQPVTTLNTSQNEQQNIEAKPTNVRFTFSGDCWVNIYDATGERIAWGIKKSGYEMNITGQAPFNVTLGKPELVAINMNGTAIDMSQFNRGNIAKFTLPLTLN